MGRETIRVALLSITLLFSAATPPVAMMVGAVPPWNTVAEIDALAWEDNGDHWAAPHPVFDDERYEIRASSGGYVVSIVTDQSQQPLPTVWVERADASLWCLGDAIQDAALTSNMTNRADEWLGR